MCEVKITALLLIITMTSGAVLASTTVSADDDSTVDQINITVPVSCTMGGTGMNSHNANIVNGTYTADIGTTTLHAFCNDGEGFAIYAAGFTGDEVGGTNSNKLVGTSASNNATIDTGLATSAGNPDVSNWAMKLAITQDSGDTTGTNAYTIDSAPNTSGGADASFSSYHVVPNEYTKVAHKNSNTDMTASTGGVKLTTTYAAYISKTQSADTYSGQVIYTLVHPANHAAPVYLNPNADDISEVNYMQQFAIVGDTNRQAIIDSMVPEQQYTVQDSRDGKSYTIAKYQTGTDSTTNQPIYDVWMTKNLDLDLDSTRTYTNEDTDIGYNTTTGEYDTAAWSPSLSTYSSSSAAWNESDTTPESYDAGDLYWNGITWPITQADCTAANGTWDSNNDYCDDPVLTASTGIAQYHLGNYYNWTAAVAMNDSSSHISSGELIEQSICPAGWTLPRVGTGEDTFYALWNQYNLADNSFIDTNNNNQYDTGETALWVSPLYFVFSGNFDGGFWSSVVNSSNVSYGGALVVFDGEASRPSYSVSRFFGLSVRCVVRPVVNSVSELDGGGAV